ncbi:MAG: sigma-54-dependent transcriptional regulator [Rubrivivax sp.]
MSAPVQRVLVVDDEPDLRTLYELTLVREGHDVECAGSVQEALAALERSSFHLLLTDMRLPDGQGIELLQHLERSGRCERAIVITAFGSAENAVAALKAGAFDYLTKPVDLKQFRAVVASALGRVPAAAKVPPANAAQTRTSEVAPLSPRPELARLVGASAAMAQVRAMVEKVSRSMAPVLVTGESGTGKELVARAIHEASARASGPFMPVNCGAIPEALLEAEFFGYRKGAFTGAQDDRPGFFQAAQGGTLFLDEIGDLPLLMQSKLLRAIQERSVRPLGATAEVPCNARIISATHRDLTADVQAGRFRQDLFFRLNVIPITVPPLRERLEDLASLCADILARIAAEAGVHPAPGVTQDALSHLGSYSFPGNVRQLENMLHRALALSGADMIGTQELGGAQALALDSAAAPLATLGRSTSEVTALRVSVPPGHPPSAATSPAAAGTPTVLPSDLAAYLDGVERSILEQALSRHRFNRTAAGASLGLSLRQMRYRMARLGVREESDS